MELSVQYWLILIGALIIVGVLLDAYRRHRNERRNPIRMRRSRFGLGGGFASDASDTAAVDAVISELPSGGARVVRARDPDELPPPPPAPRERVEPRMGRQEPAFAVPEASPPVPPPVPPPEPPAISTDTRVPLADRIAAGLDARAAATGNGASAQPVEMVVLHVLARDAAGFNGGDLLKVLRACDVRFGAMNIFHRHEEEKGQGAVQFSVANATEPGSFDLSGMDTFQTPGLSFFMRLPGPLKPLEAFDCMLETARVIVKNLDGELRDASNSAFTVQTGEHCRQRIREFAQRARARR